MLLLRGVRILYAVASTTSTLLLDSTVLLGEAELAGMAYCNKLKQMKGVPSVPTGNLFSLLVCSG